MLKLNDKIAIVCCSNPQPVTNKEKIDELVKVLDNIGLVPVVRKYIFEDNYGDGEERGKVLTDFYLDNEIKAIFDVSGGDMGNEVLDYLDFEIIQKNSKPFFGYSDLTTVINGIYTKTGNEGYLYQVRNLISKDKDEQRYNFTKSLLQDKDNLFNIDYKFIRGKSMEGTVVGGNIRCLLKLAGTAYMPSFKEKILFLEGMGGEVPQMITFLTQLKQIGAFKDISGILLGTFSKMEETNAKPTIEELILKVIDNKELPIAKTQNIGHGTNSKCLVIGKYIELGN